MNLGKRIRYHRQKAKLSQDELAEQIEVTRQSVSNWENDKTYPDIYSLLKISQLFQTNLDDLVKGETATMKQLIQSIPKKELANFHKHSRYMTIYLFVLSISYFPLLYFLDAWALPILFLLAIICYYHTHQVELFKKKYDIQTYKEIVATVKGIPLNQIEQIQEKAKRPYQQVLLVLMWTGITLFITLLTIAIVRILLAPHV